MNFPEPAFISEISDAILEWANPRLSNTDRVTKNWPLMSLGSALAVVFGYIIFVVIGTCFLKVIYGSREPATFRGNVAAKFKKEPILLLAAVYNLAQVLLCSYMMYAAINEYIRSGYRLICNKFDPSKTGMASVLWIFYVSKAFDFMDTFFIVIRRKWRQLSFLHLYHHFSIFLVYWLNTSAGYDGDIYYTIVVNSFIHFVMYSYYEATTFNITVPRPLKKMVTSMQRFQFVTMNIQAIYILVMGCSYPTRITWFYLLYIISLFALFTQFSTQEYREERPRSPKTTQEHERPRSPKTAQEHRDERPKIPKTAQEHRDDRPRSPKNQENREEKPRSPKQSSQKKVK
jgi:elongation of very long chain fatty acids protein 4